MVSKEDLEKEKKLQRKRLDKLLSVFGDEINQPKDADKSAKETPPAAAAATQPTSTAETVAIAK